MTGSEPGAVAGTEPEPARAVDEAGSGEGAADEEGPSEAAGRRGYADASNWDERYEQESEGFFDWYASYEELKGALTEHCPPAPSTQVLMVGCGNSQLSAHMCEAGYQQIKNVDISEPAVAQMREAYANIPSLEWDVMDCRAMTFGDETFDLAVDKGTVDAMMHAGPRGVRAEEADAAALVSEVWRTLRVGGLFLLVSHNDQRHGLLGRACDGGWELAELRRTSLNPQAMLINILRSKLQGRPMREAIKDPKMLTEAAHETKQALQQEGFLTAFKCFKTKKDRAREKEGGAAPPRAAALVLRQPTEAEEGAAVDSEAGGNGDGGEGDGQPAEGEAPKSLRQPCCWVYALRKVPLPGA